MLSRTTLVDKGLEDLDHRLHRILPHRHAGGLAQGAPDEIERILAAVAPGDRALWATAFFSG